jgi:hypothetical protein
VLNSIFLSSVGINNVDSFFGFPIHSTFCFMSDRGVHSGSTLFACGEDTSVIKPVGIAKELEYFFASDAR